VRGEHRSLEDFPIREGEPEPLESSALVEEPAAHAPGSAALDTARGGVAPTTARGSVAPLAARGSAAAADAAAVLLIGALAILGARVATGRSPHVSGAGWTLGFLLLLSLCSTVPALLLFGKTLGMALAEITTQSGGEGARVSAGAALRRWLGTLATAATGGLALLWTARSPDAPTPADRLSGHPLTLD
jgi:hypothetical protein